MPNAECCRRLTGMRNEPAAELFRMRADDVCISYEERLRRKKQPVPEFKPKKYRSRVPVDSFDPSRTTKRDRAPSGLIAPALLPTVSRDAITDKSHSLAACAGQGKS